MGVEFDLQLLGTFLGGWDDKDGTAARYSHSGHNYRSWHPNASPNAVGSLFVSMKVDHIRGWGSDDHAVISLDFDQNCQVVSGQVVVQISGEQEIDSGLVAAAAAPVAGPYAGLAYISAEIFNSLYSYLTRETGGRLNFPAVIQMNINLIARCVLPVPRWRDWYPLGGTLTSAPTATSWGAGRLNVYCVGAEPSVEKRCVYGWAHQENELSGWSKLSERTGAASNGVFDALAAVSRTYNSIDVFARMIPHGEGLIAPWLVHKIYNGAWQEWKGVPIGQDFPSSGPAVASWSEQRLDLFYRGYNGDLIHLWSDDAGNEWGIESLGGKIRGAPAAVSWANGRIDVFVRNMDDTLGHIWFDQTLPWHDWESLGGSLTSSPTVSSWAKDRLDVFWRGPDNSMMHLWYDNGWCKGEEPMGGILTEAPSAVSWGPDRIDCFVRGTNSGLYLKSWR